MNDKKRLTNMKMKEKKDSDPCNIKDLLHISSNQLLQLLICEIKAMFAF